jgi:hypothetical protein
MNFSLRFDTLARYLIPTSLFYLALPHLIFFVGWLKWYLALFCISLVVLPLLFCIRETGQTVEVEQEQLHGSVFSIRHVTLMLLISVLFLGISGVGGYGY